MSYASKVRVCLLFSGLLVSYAGSLGQEAHPLPVNPPTHPDSLIAATERKPAPDFKLTDSDGRALQLSKLKGKVVLLNFWATWCGGCKYEMPWFSQFDERYRAGGLQVVGVSMDEKSEAMKRYLVEKHIPYPSVLGNDDLGKMFSLGEMPLSLLIDRQGRIAVSHSGVVDRTDFEKHIQQLLRS